MGVWGCEDDDEIRCGGVKMSEWRNKERKEDYEVRT